MRRGVFFLFALAALCLSVVSTHNHMEPAPANEAAFKVFVNSRGIEYGKNQIAMPAFNKLKAKIMSENLADRIPADKKGYKVTALGHTWTEFNLDEVRLTKLDFNVQQTGIVLANQPASTLTVRVSNLAVAVELRGRWDSKKVVIRGSVNGLSLTMQLKMGAANFRPTAEIVSGDLSLTPEMLNLSVEEGVGRILGWALEKVINWCKPMGVKAIKEQFLAHYRTPNEQLARMLATLPLTKTITPKDIPALPASLGNNFKITKNIVARVSLHSAPTTSAAGLGLFFDAHTYLEGESQCDATCRRRVTPNPTGADGSFVEVQITDFLPCCLLTAAQKLGLMNYKGRIEKPKVTLPEQYKEGLEPLAKAILDNYAVSYAATMKNVPQVRFETGKVSVLVSGLQVTVFLEDIAAPKTVAGAAPKTKAVELTVTASAAATVAVKGNVINYKLSRASLTLNNLESFIPEITGIIKPELQNLIDVIIAEKVIPMANTLTSKGFAIPTVAGLTFTNPQLSLNSGYIAVKTSFTYTEPAATAPVRQLEEMEELDMDLLVDFDDEATESELPPVAYLPIAQEDSDSLIALPWDPTASYATTHSPVRIRSQNEGDYESYIDLDL